MYNTKEQVMGVVRHVLTAGGGYFAASGIVAQNELEIAISGIVAVIGIIWSVAAKR